MWTPKETRLPCFRTGFAIPIFEGKETASNFSCLAQRCFNLKHLTQGLWPPSWRSPGSSVPSIAKCLKTFVLDSKFVSHCWKWRHSLEIVSWCYPDSGGPCQAMTSNCRLRIPAQPADDEHFTQRRSVTERAKWWTWNQHWDVFVSEDAHWEAIMKPRIQDPKHWNYGQAQTGIFMAKWSVSLDQEFRWKYSFGKSATEQRTSGSDVRAQAVTLASQ